MKRKLSTQIISILTLSILVALSSTVASAYATDPPDSTTDTVTIQVPSSCSMTGVIDSNDPHTATLNNGTYDTSIGTTTITTTCNDGSGYSLYAVGYTNNTIGSNKLHHTSYSANDTTYDISTGTTIDGTVSNWAMQLTSGTNGPTIQNSFGSLHAVPDSFTQVATYSTGPTPASGSIVTTTYGVSISPNQAAGTYVGQVKYILLHPNTFAPGNFSIVYNANGGTGTMTSQTGLTNYESHTLNPNTFTAPTGKAFAGWCTVDPGGANNTCTGELFADEATIPSSMATSNGTLNLYATWGPLPTMQDFTLATCQKNVGTNGNPANVGDTLTVVDSRDGSDYTVRYLNGACWMTQNLRITGTISAADSNFTGNVFNVSEYSLASADTSYTGHCDSTNSYNYACSKDSGSETTGVWYNYYAATAGQISTNDDSNEVTQDICPAGWHLPANGTAAGQIGSITSLASAFSPVTGGRYNSGSLNLTGSGFWWSSTANNATSRYYLVYNGSSLLTGYNYRYYGFYIRCTRS